MAKKSSGCLFARAGASGFASWDDFQTDENIVSEVEFDKIKSVTYSKMKLASTIVIALDYVQCQLHCFE